jgi:hypothetical protein
MVVKRFLRLLLSITLLLAVAPIGAQEAVSEISDELNEQMDGLVIISEGLRQLDTLESVERAFPTREETIAYLTEVYDRQLPTTEAERAQLFYVALGLLPADLDLREVYLSLLGSQVAGFYDTDTKIMNVVPIGSDTPGESLSFSEQIIFVHEYVHALQDQHFGLDAIIDSAIEGGDLDTTLAISALFEGDATAVMNLYVQEVAARNPLAAFQLLAESIQAGNLTLPPGIPPALVRELLFPYEQGMSFVQAVYLEADSWDAVNAAYANPPTTTEQVMHPEKYIEGEGAIPVDAPNLSDTLPDWSLMWDIRLGEYYLREHLYTQLTLREASTAAAGWGGDRFQIAQSADGGVAWSLDLVWDTPDDADEFVAAYEAVNEERFGSAADADGCWSDEIAVVCMTFAEDGTITILNAPFADVMESLAAAR